MIRTRQATPLPDRQPQPSTAFTPKVAGLTIVRKSLRDVLPHERNPRKHPTRGSEEYRQMAASLEEDYFDPIVWNKRNNKLVSGHFRRTVLMDLGYHEADMVEVDYDEQLHIARLFAANEQFGQTDKEKATALLRELSSDSRASALLDLSGIASSRRDALLKVREEKSEPDFPIAPILGEKHDYVMIFVDNETDWAFLQQLVGVERQKSYKNTAVGTGRAIPLSKFLESIKTNKGMLGI